MESFSVKISLLYSLKVLLYFDPQGVGQIIISTVPCVKRSQGPHLGHAHRRVMHSLSTCYIGLNGRGCCAHHSAMS
jgi:hypothetical protein